MINEITCNSNNAIEMSRGELLQWLNNLLVISYTKIQQLGTGAAYCQLLDIIYPAKVPLSKVNWKAKTEYEYLNNFKVLQQSFTKLNIMKHIDVEKLVKCKYQDNLEFLQWFKKIFDSTNPQCKEYDAVNRRGERTEKQQKTPQVSHHNSSNLNMSVDSVQKEMPDMMQITPILEKRAEKQSEQEILKKFKIPEKMKKRDENIAKIIQENQTDEKEYYCTKLTEIENVLANWDTHKRSEQLIKQVRNVILHAPPIEWKMEQVDI